jgi:flagellar biosynthesis/type III secretory pathway protein FliH
MNKDWQWFGDHPDRTHTTRLATAAEIAHLQEHHRADQGARIMMESKDMSKTEYEKGYEAGLEAGHEEAYKRGWQAGYHCGRGDETEELTNEEAGEQRVARLRAEGQTAKADELEAWHAKLAKLA